MGATNEGAHKSEGESKAPDQGWGLVFMRVSLLFFGPLS